MTFKHKFKQKYYTLVIQEFSPIATASYFLRTCDEKLKVCGFIQRVPGFFNPGGAI
jgi:hypothetical protein